MKLAVLYAGQGAQHPGMGKEFYEGSPAFRAAFDSAELDFDLHRVCFEDPDGLLNQTEYTQPCMVAFACGVTAVLAQQGVKPAYVAGLSLGEYSALEAAGVFTAKQAIELAAYRGKAMAEAAKGIDCGMTAVLNLDRQALAACCEQAAQLGCVQICSASSAYSGCSVTTMMLQRGCSFWIMRVKASPFMPGISRLRKAASIGP